MAPTQTAASLGMDVPKGLENIPVIGKPDPNEPPKVMPVVGDLFLNTSGEIVPMKQRDVDKLYVKRSDAIEVFVSVEGCGEEEKPLRLYVHWTTELVTFQRAIADIIGVSFADQVLHFLNVYGHYSRGTPPFLDHEYSLSGQGVRDGATIIARRASWNGKDGKGKEQKHSDSAYYSWAMQPRVIPDDQRFSDRTSGGVPVKLEEAQVGKTETQGPRLPCASINRYSWADEGRNVKIYVSAEGEPDAVSAASAGGDSAIQTEFAQKSFQLAVTGEKAKYVLAMDDLEQPIIAAESRVRVSAGKRITISLRKEDKKVVWHTLLPRK